MNKIQFKKIELLLKNNSIIYQSEINSDTEFNNLNSLKNADSNDITFFFNEKYSSDLKETKAKACIISEKNIKSLPKSCLPIIVENPYFVLAQLSDLFSKDLLKSNSVISTNCNIHSVSSIKESVQIDSFTSILENTTIDDNVIIRGNCHIGPNVTIKKNCLIHDNVSIMNSIIEENCIIKSGARIGGSGFGFEEKSKKIINHFGNVLIMKNSQIGSNTTIDRAVFGSTKIGEYSYIDNLVQIAHNVEIGNHAIIAAQVGIAGSTKIGNNFKIGGQSGIAGHLKIGANVTVAAKSGVTKNILENKIVAGFPAKYINDWKRDIIKINKLK